MHPRKHPKEKHYLGRANWLRAAVLGANDGIISLASLVIGVASAGMDPHQIAITGFAGLVSGAMSMAAGEYVSVYSQVDSEKADLQREKAELKADPVAEEHELQHIYVQRGLSPALAAQVARELSARDALGAHARDELGITETHAPHPLQAAGASAASFTVGALCPMIVALVAPQHWIIPAISASCLLFLAALGAAAARAGGASPAKGTLRVTGWGALSMLVTAGIGMLFGPGF